MKEFLKMSLAVVVGFLFYTIIMGLIVLIPSLIVVKSVTKKTEKAKIKTNSILHLKFNKVIRDRSSDNFLENFDYMSMEDIKPLGLNDIIKNIDKAKNDEKILGIYLDLTSIDAGFSEIEEIRNALVDFKESEKFIISHADYYSHKTYYLASVADKIYLTPTGNFTFIGLSMQVLFFKNALEKIGVEPQIIRHGKFKSAIEPFILEEMSEENREQLETYLFSIWRHYLTKISESRNISVDDLNKYADSLYIVLAKHAVDFNFVDSLIFEEDVKLELKKLCEIEPSKKLHFTTLNKYMKTPNTSIDKSFKLAKDKIAVIYALGSIEMDKGDIYTIGSVGLSKAIRKARQDSSVKAVVLRINSPGGSALASEIIWNEIMLTKKDKPIVVSMGKYAASGGYYIAAPADRIIAMPNTLTGSIGVFGVLFNAQELMNDKIGINVSTVNTNTHSDIGGFYRKLTTEEEAFIQVSIEDIYAIFVNHVAEGRNMTFEQVDEIGQGRIWSGINALEIGLVDELGGLDRAIEVAVELAELDTYRTIVLPEEKDPFEQLFEDFNLKMETKIMDKSLGNSYKYYQQLNKLTKMQGIQTRMLFNLEIN